MDNAVTSWVWRDAITAVFWLSVVALLFGIARRAALWRTGRAATVAWSGLLAIPKRYFVDLHHVVAREPAVARAHVAVAGGAIACLLLRSAGVWLAGGLGADHPVIAWATAIAQATLAAVAPGIAEALVATAMGLFAAIPAVVAYNRFAGDVNRLAIRFDSFMEEFSNILQRQVH